MKKFTESIEICNTILELYPNNADVLFDKSCNYALLNDYPNCLKNLKMAINISNKFKINSRKNKSKLFFRLFPAQIYQNYIF